MKFQSEILKAPTNYVPGKCRVSNQQILVIMVMSILTFAVNTRAAIPEASGLSEGDSSVASSTGSLQASSQASTLLGKWMKLDRIRNVKTVGLDGTVYKGVCSEDEVSNAFSFNNQQIGDAPSNPILTSHPQFCARLDFNSVMYFPAEIASAGKINGSSEEIVLAQVEGHPAMRNLDDGKSTMHVVRGVRLKANCKMRNRPKMMGMMTDTLMDCEIAEGGTGTLTFLVK